MIAAKLSFEISAAAGCLNYSHYRDLGILDKEIPSEKMQLILTEITLIK